MNKKGLRGVNTATVVTVSLLLVAVAAVTTLLFQSRAVKVARDNAYASLQNTAAGQAGALDAMLEGKFELLEAFSGAISPTADGKENIQSRMRAVAGAAGFVRLLYSDKEGLTYSSDGSELDVSDRAYFAASLRGGRAVERLASGRVSQAPKLILSVPVYEDGALAGVLAGSFEEASFSSVVFRDAPAYSMACICDSHGDVILASRDELAGKNVLAELREMKLNHSSSMAGVAADMAAGEPGVLAYSTGNTLSYAVYEPLGVNDWMLFTVLRDDAGTDATAQLKLWGYIQAGVVLLTALALLYYIILNQRRYRQQLELYRSMDQGGVFSLNMDEGLSLIYANDKFYQMFGYTQSSLREKLGGKLIRCVAPADAEGVRDALKSVLEGGGSYFSRVVQIVSGTGEIKHVLMSGVAEGVGEKCVLSGVAVDITEQKRGEAELAALYRRELSYRKAMEPNFYSTALYNVTRRAQVDMHARNENEERYVGKPLEEFARMAADSVVEDPDVKHYFEALDTDYLLRRAEKTSEPVAFDYLKAMPDGSARWMHYESHLLRAPDSGDLMAFFYLTDIDSTKNMVMELEEAARRDSMTGLLNHDAVLGEMKRYLRMEGAGGFHALIMVDLDNFKQVNDSLGHQRGDAILSDTADILRRCFRGSDIVGRVGGDEFLILMKNAASVSRVKQKAQELLQSLQFACLPEAGGEPAQVSSSVGVAICREQGKSFEQLYSEADGALYRAKNAGRSRYCVAGGDYGGGNGGGAAGSNEALRLQTLLEYMDCGVIAAEVGDEIDVSYVSPSLSRAFRRGPGELGAAGERLFDLVLPEDSPGLFAAIRDAAVSQAPLDHVCRVRCADGSVGKRHLRLTRVPGEGRADPTVVAVATDITKLELT